MARFTAAFPARLFRRNDDTRRQFSSRRLVRVGLAFSLTASFLLPARASDPETEIEKLIGKAVAYALRDASGIDDDPVLLPGVKSIGAKMAQVSPRKSVNYSYEILGSDVANAVAAPGGHIFVTRGMLDTIESDDELAGILAHETGHVAKRHAAQQIEGNLLVLALLSTLKGSKYDGVKLGAGIANVFRTLKKSREMERQADEEGLKFSYQAGYDPEGLVKFLDGLKGDRRNLLEQYFATHPSPSDRVENARKFGIVNRNDKEAVQKIANGFQARGLPSEARVLLNGGDPLLLPPLTTDAPPNLTAVEQADREIITKRGEAVRHGLVKSYKAQRFGDNLQALLLINSNAGDARWVFIASRAYAVQTNVADIYARTLRVSRTSAPTYDSLVRSEQAFAGDEAARTNARLGKYEARRAMEKMDGVPSPIGRAANTAALVLTDLNNRFYNPKGAAGWTRYVTLEASLRYAESELSRADKESGQAWRLLSLARIRRYELRLNELAPENNPARRALWADLARRRLGRAFDVSGPTGGATVRAALAIETRKSESEIEAGRGTRTWADWVSEKNGVPENIATILRLLVLDLERETQTSPNVPPANPSQNPQPPAPPVFPPAGGPQPIP